MKFLSKMENIVINEKEKKMNTILQTINLKKYYGEGENLKILIFQYINLSPFLEVILEVVDLKISSFKIIILTELILLGVHLLIVNLLMSILALAR